MALRYLIALALTGAASADLRWEHVTGPVYKLVETKVTAPVVLDEGDGARYLACVVAPRTALPGCPQAHAKRVHVWLGEAGDPAAEAMMDSAKLALAQGRYVTVHVDTNDTVDNRFGEPRCKAVRFVVARKP